MFNIPVSNGELLDKITILMIKHDKITDVQKKKHITKELNELTFYLQSLQMEQLETLFTELKQVNAQLWEIEDELRNKERNKVFDDEFIQLARKVYFTNDKRFQIKQCINNITNSEFNEVKSYEKYN